MFRIILLLAGKIVFYVKKNVTYKLNPKGIGILFRFRRRRQCKRWSEKFLVAKIHSDISQFSIFRLPQLYNSVKRRKCFTALLPMSTYIMRFVFTIVILLLERFFVFAFLLVFEELFRQQLKQSITPNMHPKRVFILSDRTKMGILMGFAKHLDSKEQFIGNFLCIRRFSSVIRKLSIINKIMYAIGLP